jgi:hypothetical protein
VRCLVGDERFADWRVTPESFVPIGSFARAKNQELWFDATPAFSGRIFIRRELTNLVHNKNFLSVQVCTYGASSTWWQTLKFSAGLLQTEE